MSINKSGCFFLPRLTAASAANTMHFCVQLICQGCVAAQKGFDLISVGKCPLHYEFVE